MKLDVFDRRCAVERSLRADEPGSVRFSPIEALEAQAYRERYNLAQERGSPDKPS